VMFNFKYRFIMYSRQNFTMLFKKKTLLAYVIFYCIDPLSPINLSEERLLFLMCLDL
jgi:hypothetical protein